MTLPDAIARLSADLRHAPDAPAVSLAEIMSRRAIPGVGLAVIAEGRIEWAGGWGVADAEEDRDVTTQTLFQAGSISKPVAAQCALRLVAEGRLALDEDVNERLRSWRVPANDGWQPRVTLRQLLSHTAGLTVHGFPGYARDVTPPTLVDVLDGRGNTEAVRVRTLPGLQFSYSGGGYCVLQQLVVDVTRTPFPELARELVLEPLAMRESTYEQPLPERRARQAATGHRTGGKPVYGRWHVYPEMAAAGLWTTPSDLARFALAIQAARAGATDAILPRDLVAELLTPQAANVPMGLGLLLEGEPDSLRFGHSGDDQGFVAKLSAYADHGLGAVAMTNSDSGWWAIEPLLSAVARHYGWPEAATPGEAAPLPGEADACAGVYESAGYRFRVEVADSGLALAVPGQPPIELASVSATEWRARSLALRVVFTLGADGDAESARLVQDAEYVQPLDATRVG